MRNWKRYSSVARDGEKTVYCEKGKHSVYYGNAFISFKPSKLIWCEDCKNTYYEVKPTLFDDQVIQKELTVTQDQAFKPMTEKQIKFIRDLFKAMKEFMTIDEQESLIKKMKGHIDGSAVLSTTWAQAAIKKLKSYNTERSAS